jgi:hypothetical protein
LKKEKCKLFQEEGVFCGFIITGEGIIPQVDAAAEIENIKEPTTVKEMQSYLGSLYDFRLFIPGFAEISAPLSNLTKKTTVWIWGKECEESFRQLKSLLSSAGMLRNFDPSKDVYLHTEPSLYAIGGWIGQEHRGGIRPCSYWSRKHGVYPSIAHRHFNHRFLGYQIAFISLCP